MGTRGGREGGREALSPAESSEVLVPWARTDRGGTHKIHSPQVLEKRNGPTAVYTNYTMRQVICNTVIQDPVRS